MDRMKIILFRFQKTLSPSYWKYIQSLFAFSWFVRKCTAFVEKMFAITHLKLNYQNENKFSHYSASEGLTSLWHWCNTGTLVGKSTYKGIWLLPASARLSLSCPMSPRTWREMAFQAIPQGSGKHVLMKYTCTRFTGTFLSSCQIFHFWRTAANGYFFRLKSGVSWCCHHSSSGPWIKIQLTSLWKIKL